MIHSSLNRKKNANAVNTKKIDAKGGGSVKKEYLAGEPWTQLLSGVLSFR